MNGFKILANTWIMSNCSQTFSLVAISFFLCETSKAKFPIREERRQCLLQYFILLFYFIPFHPTSFHFMLLREEEWMVLEGEGQGLDPHACRANSHFNVSQSVHILVGKIGAHRNLSPRTGHAVERATSSACRLLLSLTNFSRPKLCIGPTSRMKQFTQYFQFNFPSMSLYWLGITLYEVLRMDT